MLRWTEEITDFESADNELFRTYIVKKLSIYINLGIFERNPLNGFKKILINRTKKIFDAVYKDVLKELMKVLCVENVNIPGRKPRRLISVFYTTASFKEMSE